MTQFLKNLVSILSALILIACGYAIGIVHAMPRDRIQQEQETLIRITAYCPNFCCCNRWADGYTASGYKIQKGDRFVAAPKHIPFGTKVIVPGYNNNKPVEVRDRGGSITVNRLDIFFDSHQEALNWGVKMLKVKVLK